MGRSRSLQDDISNNTGDVSRMYKWSATYLWAKEISIQVDIGGHPPIPTSSKHFFGNLLFLAVFRVLNFWGHFEGLNDVFSRSGTSMIT
jgi:hypothetical protein